MALRHSLTKSLVELGETRSLATYKYQYKSSNGFEFRKFVRLCLRVFSIQGQAFLLTAAKLLPTKSKSILTPSYAY